MSTVSSQPVGEVYDLGYQHYDGPRRGRPGAFLAVFADGLRAAAGLGRGGAQKILPIVFVLLGLAPAVFIVVLAGVAQSFGADPDEINLPAHPDYYGFSWFIILLFSAAVAPALLCPDRRNSVFALYAVRPLTSLDYVFARWLAFLAIALAFVYLPQLLLLVSFILSAESPGDYVSDHWQDIPAVFGAGLGIALFMTSLAMAAASLTSRRAFATAGVIGFIIMLSAVGGFGQALLSEGGQAVETGGNVAAHWSALLILPEVSGELVSWAFGTRTHFALSPWISLGWVAALTAGFAAVMAWRYRRPAL